MGNKFKNLLSFQSWNSLGDDCDCGAQNLDDCNCGDSFDGETFEKKSNKSGVSYKKSGLKRPKKADLNGDGKLTEYEIRRGKAIETAIEKSKRVGKGGK